MISVNGSGAQVPLLFLSVSLGYDEAQMKALCKKWRAGEITATAAMKELGLKPNTFYRRVKEMGL